MNDLHYYEPDEHEKSIMMETIKFPKKNNKSLLST
jgi:hypothetical protein